MSLRVFIEGGGPSEDQKRRCREGFGAFIEPFVKPQARPRLLLCGSRREAYDDFCHALTDGRGPVALLVDAEDPVAVFGKPWNHLASRPDDKMPCPPGATDDDAHLMVICMEAWFLADKDALRTYFDQGFSETALPRNEDVEKIAKKDLFDGLKAATRHTKTKGEYDKGRHSFELLGKIDPKKVRAMSRWANRFVERIERCAPPPPAVPSPPHARSAPPRRPDRRR